MHAHVLSLPVNSKLPRLHRLPNFLHLSPKLVGSGTLAVQCITAVGKAPQQQQQQQESFVP
ncbi:hypothetical protein TYRP_001794 [Tyrophagus putrescentiae]|nr:hypothetical protein TYRP_001794 [Tyrophagus putrescentiae]